MAHAGAYLGLDQRPHIRADWHGPAGPLHVGKEFLLDSGASISGIDHENAVSLSIAGLRGIQGVTGPVQQTFLVAGGEADFEVDGPAGPHRIVYDRPFAILGFNVLGADAFAYLGLKLSWDFSTQPATVSLSS